VVWIGAALPSLRPEPGQHAQPEQLEESPLTERQRPEQRRVDLVGGQDAVFVEPTE